MRKKNKSFPKKTAILLAASAVLLVGSAVGSTRAALTYYSENYTAQVEMSNIGVSLLENGTVVSSRDYSGDGEWTTNGDGKLLTKLLGEDAKFTPGKPYTEELSVQNSGNIDTFVRVIITKSWQDENGKDVSLNPEWIELNVPEGNGWIEATDNTDSPERMVLYYTDALSPDEESNPLSDTLRINEAIAKQVTVETDESTGTITYVYEYDGYSFVLEAEVDAVQTHNAAEAIKSAWGIDATVSADETTITGIQ